MASKTKQRLIDKAIEGLKGVGAAHFKDEITEGNKAIHIRRQLTPREVIEHSVAQPYRLEV